MKWITLSVCVFAGLSAGCKKAMDKIESAATTPSSSSPAPSSSGPYSGGGNPTVLGATQAVRGAADRTVTLNELNNLKLFMYNAYSANGQVPDSRTTFDLLKEDQKLYNLVKDGLVVLVSNPTPEGVWAYVKEAPTTGGFVVTQQGVERMTPQQFQALPK
ncbi:hypothetical protein [Zavarzinella formosa]|uniref:hypothetical protein n=1 Tax=Zavarzinella formosa TaxID=360055 RepID=UPI0003004E47|nr:hypothetical protein [Zavarzinella formosa]